MTHWLDRIRARRRPDTYPEVRRVITLPRTGKVSKATVNKVSKQYVQGAEYDAGYRLFPSQVGMLQAYDKYDGAFGNIAVGNGKTDTALLTAALAMKKGVSRVMLLVPPDVYQQLVKRDIPRARQKLVFNIPVFGLGKKPRAKRAEIARSGCGLYLMTYSLLSTSDSQELLRTIDAGLVICDEAQELRNLKSAKTKRFFAWVKERQPHGVCMSGTLTTKSPMDYHHLLRWCLGANSPLPRTVVGAQVWSTTVMSQGRPNREQMAQVRPLLDWAKTDDPREAYRKRFESCPGVVSTGMDKLGTSLLLRNTPAMSPSSKLVSLMNQVEESWVSPNGDELTSSLEKHLALSELSAGFYTRRVWPEHRLREEAIQAWKLRQAYNKEVREFIGGQRKPIDGLDTPGLVEQGVWGHDPHLPQSLSDAFWAWHDWTIMFSGGLPERLSEPVRVDSYKVDLAVRWALSLSHPGGIIWVHHQEMGRWVAEALTAAGLPVLEKVGGAEWLQDDGSDKYFCVASIEAHHKGKNLQHHKHQFILQWPRSSEYMEQLLGRCHRQGQTADRLIVTTCLSNAWDLAQKEGTLEDTRYVQETTGNAQKLLYCDWEMK